MVDLETLTLQINTESQQAYTAIGKLAQRLDSLSVSIAKLEVGKLNDLARGLDSLNFVIANMNATTSKWDYKRIVGNISQLAMLNTAGLDTLSASLGTLTASLGGMSTAAASTESIKNMISAIGKLGGKNIERAIVNLPKLEKEFNKPRRKKGRE